MGGVDRPSRPFFALAAPSAVLAVEPFTNNVEMYRWLEPTQQLPRRQHVPPRALRADHLNDVRRPKHIEARREAKTDHLWSQWHDDPDTAVSYFRSRTKCEHTHDISAVAGITDRRIRSHNSA